MTPEKRELLRTLESRFTSGNDVPVTRAMITREEYEQLRSLLADREGFVTVPVERLEEIASALDRGLGDSDITHIESDEELKEEEPIQWACSQLNHLIAAATKEGQ